MNVPKDEFVQPKPADKIKYCPFELGIIYNMNLSYLNMLITKLS